MFFATRVPLRSVWAILPKTRPQGLVMREDADGAHGRDRGHHLHLVIEDLALRGEDLDLEGRAGQQWFLR